MLALAVIALLACTGLVLGCEDPGRDAPGSRFATPPPPPERDAASPPDDGATPLPPRLICPADSGNCAAARGRIIYVEAEDPDGDGDAHFVLESEESITLKGISVIDVAAHLRPEPLPRPGDSLSAVGPVYRGSFGQAQIEATEIRYRRAPNRASSNSSRPRG